MSLTEILNLPEVQRFSGSNSQLFEFVKKLAKANVGHGISEEYYKTRFEFGYINSSNIGGMLLGAKYHKGSFGKARMAKGLKAYWTRRKLKESENQI